VSISATLMVVLIALYAFDAKASLAVSLVAIAWQIFARSSAS
jgi:hypothetical protein